MPSRMRILFILFGVTAVFIFFASKRGTNLTKSRYLRGSFLQHQVYWRPDVSDNEVQADFPVDLAQSRVNDSHPFPWKPKKSSLVNCAGLLKGDENEMRKALLVQAKLNETYIPLDDAKVTLLALDCDKLKEERGFIMHHLTEEERDFPIAYSILVYSTSEQVLDLLAAIYRPQNVYCIHVDAKVKGHYREAILSVANCFPNIFMASRSVNVLWGRFAVLEAELVCMKDLFNYKKWKYFINLTGQEFPLKTNYELMKILQAFNGANNVRVSRKQDFVDFVLHNKIAKDLLEWSKGIRIPDESFFQMVNYHPWLKLRGSYLGEPETNATTNPFLVRYKRWGPRGCAFNKTVHGICILTVGDLPALHKAEHLFANKFYAKTGRLALDCLAESLYNRTRDEFLGKLQFNDSYYKSLPFVKNTYIPT